MTSINHLFTNTYKRATRFFNSNCMVASDCAKMANAYGGITYDVDENITNSLNKAFCMALLLVFVAA